MTQLFLIDSFTDKPFAGNPAGVCLLDKPMSEKWMTSIAAEVNASETAFVTESMGKFNIRWFTPTVEVPLCGHATLASAHALWESGKVKKDQSIVFGSKSGDLKAKLAGDIIELDFPSAEVLPSPIPVGLLEALGITEPPLFSGTKSDFNIAVLEISSEAEVGKLKPNFSRLAAIDIPAVIVTSKADQSRPYDFVSRFFGPNIGINEDPVTGAAHCALGPYWAKKLGKPELLGYQASVRGGLVKVRPEGKRILLGGLAVTLYEAKLRELVTRDENV